MSAVTVDVHCGSISVTIAPAYYKTGSMASKVQADIVVGISSWKYRPEINDRISNRLQRPNEGYIEHLVKKHISSVNRNWLTRLSQSGSKARTGPMHGEATKGARKTSNRNPKSCNLVV